MEEFTVEIIPHTLIFKKPATTSRSTYLQHQVWYVLLTSTSSPQHIGIGEVAPLPHLSDEYSPLFASHLTTFAQELEKQQKIDPIALKAFPSILFGFETALKHFRTGHWKLWNTPFTRGEEGILINGLIWMGSLRWIQQQIEQKLKEGFKCLKIKIGALNFEEEISLLRQLRKRFPPEILQIRVDANGAFSPNCAEEKLHRLAQLGLHSIEQPIKAGNVEKMKQLAHNTPIPIALDEELIGTHQLTDKQQLIEYIRPQYIILKPTLHGGMVGCHEWIQIASRQNIPYWITSALESNVGLNAIAQWCSSLTDRQNIPQGLGTGMLYTNNIPIPLHIRGEKLWLSTTDKLSTHTLIPR